MTRLPTLTPKKVLMALLRAGYREIGQSGSHLMLEHDSRPTTTVPIHPKDLKRSMMKKIIRQAGFSEAEFRRLF